MPEISIILKVWNGEEFLRETLDAALIQDHGNYEIVVVNDGSTDGTEAIIDEYVSRDCRIRAFHRSHRGVAAASNYAITCARGEWLAFLDADDVCLPNRLSTQLQFATSRKLDVCGCAIENIGEYESIHRYHEYDADIRHGFCVWENAFANPALFIRAEVARRYPYDESLDCAIDFDLWCRLLTDSGLILGNYPEPLLKYRVHPGQMSSTLNASQIAVAADRIHGLMVEGLGLADDSKLKTHIASRGRRAHWPLDSRELESYGEFLVSLHQVLLDRFGPSDRCFVHWKLVLRRVGMQISAPWIAPAKLGAKGLHPRYRLRYLRRRIAQLF